MTRPFAFGDYWAIRTEQGLRVYVNDTEAYEAWHDAQSCMEGSE